MARHNWTQYAIFAGEGGEERAESLEESEEFVDIMAGRVTDIDWPLESDPVLTP